ncbi:Tetratricopeptide TPR_2 [Trichodesmium erythraeum IMS101]|uniref:Tetratricopeptide TPR_2 n=1 Tax=Trichodesmium erythraeum (strain IMS101) TaxID=203124 RepID=Q111G1_TRIEI
MKRIIVTCLIGITTLTTTALILPLLPQSSYAQSSNSQAEKLEQLIKTAQQQIGQYQYQESIETLQEALAIARKIKDRKYEAVANLGLGYVYDQTGQPQKALEFYEKALPIWQEVGYRFGEATTLNNIGGVYSDIGQPQKALEFYEKALPISQEVGARSQEATTLNNIGLVYDNIGQPQKALEYYEKALPISQEVGARSQEATTLNNIGLVYSSIGQPQKALEYYEKALPISQEMGAHSQEATTLNNIGLVYSNIGQPQKALEFFEKALPIWQEVGYRSQEATTLNNIGNVYSSIGQPQKALEYLQKALPIMQEVGARSLESTTLSSIGKVYRDSNQPEKAIDHLEKSVKITLEIRGGLKKENRKTFLNFQYNKWTPIALIDLLIDQNQPEAAWKWYNLATTFDLADYTRLIKAKVKNPEAQKLINQWEENYQKLQALYSKIEDGTTTQLSQQIKQLQAENNQLAENASQKYPEVAELFEFEPKDIDKLKANIPPGTVVIQPALLTGLKSVPDSIAIFLVTRDQATLVKKLPIDAKEFDSILTEYRSQLEKPNADNYATNQEKLYDYLIRPIETEIAAYSPKRLAIIPTGKLRYIPFETLYDNQTEQYLIAKYPIHYLTRISATRQEPKEPTKSLKVLAFGNPQPTEINLRGAEDEAKIIAENLSGKSLTREKATLSSFENESPGFPLVHLATHGCFQKGGCREQGLEENTILFANNKTFNIANAARLGLENTDLIALSACQTAMKADSNGEEIAGVAYLFERAGADAVIASLWNAEDGTTKDIMVKFYDNLKQGMTKVEALRQAKLSYARSDVSPFYWSPFILIGDGE